MILTDAIFGQRNEVNLKPNTFIGGVASTIPDKATLAGLLNISANNIPIFQIVGDSIEARVNQDYNTGSNFLWKAYALTWWRDLDSHWKSTGSITFKNCPIIEVVANGLVTTGPQFCRGSNVLAKLELNSLTILDSYCLEDAPIDFLNLPSITKITALGIGRNINIIFAPNCKFFGDDLTNNNVFFYAKSGLKIYVHKDLDPSDADITDAQSKGVTVKRIQNTTTPNPVTNLSIGTKYNTALQLNFTPPSSVNAIDYYECYANGVYKNDISASGGYITGLTPGTQYDITLTVIDEFYNKIKISNIATTTTTTTTTTGFPVAGLVSYYKLDEASSNQVIDSWGANHGTNNGATIGVPGKIGNSFSFNNTLSNRISIPDSNNFSFTNGVNDIPFSFSFWFNTEAITVDQMIINKLAAQREWYLYLVGGKMRIYLEGNGSMYAEGGSFQNNNWYHCVVTYDGSKTPSGFKIYINNTEISLTTSNSNYTGTINGSDSVIIGNHGNQTSNIGFKGKIDELGIFKNKALNVGEISAIYNNGNGLTI